MIEVKESGPVKQPKALLHTKVVEGVRGKISRGEYQDLLPTIKEIAAEHDVSVITARKAIQVLQEEGALAVRQGSGTYIAGSLKTRTRRSRVVSSAGRVEGSDIDHSEQVILPKILFGLGLYFFTQCRVAELAYIEFPTAEGLMRVMQYEPRVKLFVRYMEAAKEEPEDSALLPSILQVFRQEISVIKRAPTLGDALVRLASTH